MNKGTIFVPFTKTEKTDDGHVKVYGQVVDDLLDVDGQITDLDWFRSQMGQYEKWMNVREMHQASAVGVGLSFQDNGSSIDFLAEIIDPVAAEKCETGVYKGFSYGIKGTPGNPYKVTKDMSAPNGRICGGTLAEISICDRPALPNSVFSLVKMMDADSNSAHDVFKMLAAEITKGEPNPELNNAFDILEDYEIDDAQLMLVAANLVRYIMLRRLHEQAEPDESLQFFLMDLGGIYDTLLSYSADEAVDSWEAMASRIISGLVTSHTLEEVIADASAGVESEGDATANVDGEMMIASQKALVAALNKMLTPLEDSKTMDKDELVSIVKAMTVEERKEVGLITLEEIPASPSQKDFDALKAVVTEIGKRATPGGPSLKGAVPALPQSTEAEALVAEKASFLNIINKSMDVETRQYASQRIAAIDQQLTALQQS